MDCGLKMTGECFWMQEFACRPCEEFYAYSVDGAPDYIPNGLVR